MSGPAVTMVDSGGVPITRVDSGAPLMSVRESGGVPVTLVDQGGAPFVLEGYALWTPSLVGGMELGTPEHTFTRNTADGWDNGANSDVAYSTPFTLRGTLISGAHIVLGISPTQLAASFLFPWCWYFDGTTATVRNGGAPVTGATPTLSAGDALELVCTGGPGNWDIEFAYYPSGLSGSRVVHHTLNGLTDGPLYIVVGMYSNGAEFGPVTRTPLD